MENFVTVFNHEQPKFLPINECKIVHEDGTSIPYTEFNNLFNKTINMYARALVNKATFGEAVKALNNGQMVAREGWDIKGMFVFKQPLPDKVAEELTHREFPIIYRHSSQLALVDEMNRISNWAPSGTDALANDWIIYE